jgi:hypothetical protein
VAAETPYVATPKLLFMVFLFIQGLFQMTTQNDNARSKKARAGGGRERRPADTKYLRDWLDSLGLEVNPSIHINGHVYSNALVVVDFGSPIKHVKLSSEQNAELGDRLRLLAKDVLGREASIRVSHDGPNGVYWASVS